MLEESQNVVINAYVYMHDAIKMKMLKFILCSTNVVTVTKDTLNENFMQEIHEIYYKKMYLFHVMLWNLAPILISFLDHSDNEIKLK